MGVRTAQSWNDAVGPAAGILPIRIGPSPNPGQTDARRRGNVAMSATPPVEGSLAHRKAGSDFLARLGGVPVHRL
jgi:hypothetical protein